MRELETLAAHDPAIAEALDRQRRARALIHGAADEVRAPLGLRESLERERERHARGLRRRRGRWLSLAVAGAAVAVLAVVLAASGGPTVEDAAAFSARPASAAAPAAAGDELRIAQDGVAFPDWSEEGWRATGSHRGEVGGRPATTVYYVKDGREIAYTIVGGEPLDVAAPGRRRRRRRHAPSGCSTCRAARSPPGARTGTPACSPATARRASSSPRWPAPRAPTEPPDRGGGNSDRVGRLYGA